MGLEDPFLRESWERRVAEERGVRSPESAFEETAWGTYVIMMHVAHSKDKKKREKLEPLFDDVTKAILRYVGTVARSGRTRLEERDIDAKEKMDEVESSDKARMTAHNALISSIDIFARTCDREKLDSAWHGMIGFDRTKIQHWAEAVAKYLTAKPEEP